MYNKPVKTGVGDKDKNFTKEATLVYWVIVNPNTAGTQGTLKIIDGVNANGTERARFTTAYNQHMPFYPPLRCDDGLFIDMDSNIGSYTVGYLTEAIAMGE